MDVPRVVDGHSSGVADSKSSFGSLGSNGSSVHRIDNLYEPAESPGTPAKVASPAEPTANVRGPAAASASFAKGSLLNGSSGAGAELIVRKSLPVESNRPSAASRWEPSVWASMLIDTVRELDTLNRKKSTSPPSAMSVAFP